MKNSNNFKHELNVWASKGGKTHRKRTIKRIEHFIKCANVKHPAQIGKRHIYEFFEKNDFASSTKRDYYYAIRVLWNLLNRNNLKISIN